MTTKGSDPAYPAQVTTHRYIGLTKREEFTKAALSGMDLFRTPPHTAGDKAVEIADCTIAALNTEKSDGKNEHD